MVFQNRRYLALPLLVIFLVSRAQALDSFGGDSCATKGDWTKDALSQSKEIENTITTLRDDPNCKGLESILPKIHESYTSLGDEDVKSNRLEDLHSKMDSLRQALEKGGLIAAEVADPLLAMTPEIQQNMDKATVERAKRSVNYGTSLVDELFKVMPNYQLCMNKHPDQRLALVGAAIQMTGAIAGSGEGITGRLGNTIGNLVSYMRNNDYAKILRGPAESQYWNSMSCLVETTSQTYCKANEAYSLLDFQSNNAKSDAQAKPGSPSLHDGYNMINRELPIVSDWLTKVQFGVTPRISTDADFKNTTLDAMNNFLKTANGLKGAYSEEMLQYENLTDPTAKKNLALETIVKMNAALENNAENSMTAMMKNNPNAPPSKPGERNFFTSTVNKDLLPYYLLGKDEIPKEVIQARERNGMMTNFSNWSVGDGSYQEDFKKPDETMKVIGERLDKLIDQSMEKAGAYFNQRMIIDSQNLVNESVTSNTMNVQESLKHIRNYLSGLIPRAKADPVDGIKLVPSLIDTTQRIDRVLAAYDDVKRKVDDVMTASSLVAKAGECKDQSQRDKLVGDVRQALDRIAPGSGPVDFSNLDDSLKKRINTMYVDVVNKAYTEFNVLLQRNGFLQNRVTNFVKYDYADRIKNHENMTDYQKQILTVSGRSMMDEMVKVNQLNPVQQEQDLNSAQVINTKNIEAVSSLMGDNFHEAIDAMNLRTGGVVSSETMNAGKPASWFASKSTADTTVKGSGDENHAFDQFRAKLCVQTLSFDNWQKYQAYCAGSVLSSRFQKNNPTLTGLNVKYDDLAKDRAKGVGTKSKYVCALRNYIQQNRAYWLVHQND